MAHPNDIPTDLALELSATRVPPEKFLHAVRAFFGMVEEVTKSLAGLEDVVEWGVRVKEGSAIIGLEPISYTVAPSVLEGIEEHVRRGLETLDGEATEPAHFPEAALRHARELANLVATSEDDDTEVRVWVKRKPTALTHRVVANAVELLKERYQDYGTVEGRLQVVSERGVLHFDVQDPVTHRWIRCIVDEAKVPAVLAAFGKRAEVSGLIRYRRDGTPLSIEVEKLVEFPGPQTLPQFSDVLGILKESA